MTTNTASHKIAIIGGGIMGVALAHKLSQHGFEITIYERGSNLGGLAGYIDYDGIRMDRFYHTILSSDMSMQGLMEAAQVTGKRHFVATKQGFYDKGKLYSFNTPLDFAFPPLNIFQRFRLGLQVIYAQFESDWHKMDTVPVADWLIKVSGRGVYNKVWKPLRAKFDTTAADVPATYIWSRLRRMMGTREGVQSTEMMCYLENSYYTLIEGLAQQCSERGVTFHLNTVVQNVVIENGQATGIQTADGIARYDSVISTLPSPTLAGLIPDAPEDFRALLNKQEYLGVLCPMLLLKKQLMPYYVLNITDESIPFTAVVETTNLIDPQYTKGHHIVYLPKYIAPDNKMAQWPDEQVREEWMKHFRRMFPDFDESLITEFWVHRARYVEPIRPMGTLDEIPPVQTPVDRLYMGNTVMIYPELGNGEAVTRYAAKLADQVIADAPNWAAQPVPSVE